MPSVTVRLGYHNSGTGGSSGNGGKGAWSGTDGRDNIALWESGGSGWQGLS